MTEGTFQHKSHVFAEVALGAHGRQGLSQNLDFKTTRTLSGALFWQDVLLNSKLNRVVILQNSEKRDE